MCGSGNFASLDDTRPRSLSNCVLNPKSVERYICIACSVSGPGSYDGHGAPSVHGCLYHGLPRLPARIVLVRVTYTAGADWRLQGFAYLYAQKFPSFASSPGSCRSKGALKNSEVQAVYLTSVLWWLALEYELRHTSVKSPQKAIVLSEILHRLCSRLSPRRETPDIFIEKPASFDEETICIDFMHSLRLSRLDNDIARRITTLPVTQMCVLAGSDSNPRSLSRLGGSF